MQQNRETLGPRLNWPEREVKITASVRNARGSHQVAVSTGGRGQELVIPAKEGGGGSAVNGGEFLFLALATCYCNDVYREAAREGLKIESVEVTVSGTFGARGDPAQGIVYSVRVESPESELAVRELLRETDRVAEIQNTLRSGVDVVLSEVVLG